MNESETPVFVRGLSRSGGTMLVTLLDAHPAISMGYELYPNLLNTGDNTPTATKLLAILSETPWEKALEKLQPNKVGIYLARCDRGGLSPEQVIEILTQFVEEGHSFDTNAGQMEFMARCCRGKQETEGAKLWGLKCNQQFENYTAIWPGAFFLNIIRDGRDVLASQLNTGAFKPNPAKLAAGWAKTHREFREFASQNENKGLEISYEKLVTKPDSETRKICDFLKIDFDESMLSFHQKDLTIFSANHLSMEQISKPINTSKIGRWKSDVPQAQIDEFMNVAGDAMEDFGCL